MYVAQYIEFNKNISMVTSGSLGNMEAGLPNAIGVKIAYPNAKVICVIGDFLVVKQPRSHFKIQSNGLN